MDHKFTVEEYRDAIFMGKLPSRTLYPFKRWPHSPYRNKGIVFTLIEDNIVISDLKSEIELLNRATPLDFHKLSPFIAEICAQDFFALLGSWLSKENLIYVKNIAESQQSQLLWSTYKYNHTILPGPPNAPQMIWIYINDMQERNNANTYTESLFDYLSMMVNPNLYQQLQKSQTNARENVSYDSMHEALKAGDMEALDEIVKVES